MGCTPGGSRGKSIQGKALLGERAWGRGRGWILNWPGYWSCPAGEGAELFMVGVVCAVDSEGKALL